MVNILGTVYEIETKQYGDDPWFKENSCDAYCDGTLKKIVMCDLKTWPRFEKETDECLTVMRKEVLRHEIVHAFLNESGLRDSALTADGPWARNEEMVDWFAIQGPKIYEAWQSVSAI